MKYIINERQYKLLTEQEEKILRIPFAAFGNKWEVLQKFLEKRGFPPYEITDDLNLSFSKVEDLGNLISVGGNLYLEGSEIKSLGKLTSVGGSLDLRGSGIKDLGKLKYVGGDLYMDNSYVESLGNLTSVGGDLYMVNSDVKSLGNLTSVGGSLDLIDTPLSRKYFKEEIRSMVEVGGKVYL